MDSPVLGEAILVRHYCMCYFFVAYTMISATYLDHFKDNHTYMLI